jgi:hypothetical protein
MWRVFFYALNWTHNHKGARNPKQLLFLKPTLH